MRFINILFALCLFILSTNTYSQSKDEKAVEEAVETFRKGVELGDRSILESIAADQLLYGHSNGKVQDKQAFVDEIVSNNPFDYANVTITNQTIRVSDNTAIVRHTYGADTKNPSGAAGKISIGNMLIFQKQNGKWKLLARQAYRL